MSIKSLIFLFITYITMINSSLLNAQVNDYSHSLNSFSFDLYQQTKVEQKNLLLSPLSTYYLLLMAYEGSKNITKKEFEEVLYLKSSDSLKNNFLNHFESKIDTNLNFNVFNSIWFNKNIELETEYRKRVTDIYLSDLKQTDFANTQLAISDINSWISDKTNQKINEIVNSNNIDSSTQVVLLNAVYFKGEWLNVFEKRSTSAALFYSSAENQYEVDFMKKTERLQYFENDEFQFIAKPYKDTSLSFCIILPKNLFGIGEIEGKMNSDFFEKIIDNTHVSLTSLSIPKFKLELSYDISEELKNAGLKSAFSNQADFSGISQKTPLMFHRVIHKTSFELDEEKTEAAAATASVTRIIGLPPSYKVFNADHPFVFFIIDNTTKSILFLGRYVEPINGKKLVENMDSLSTNLEKRKDEKITINYKPDELLYIIDKKIVTQADLAAIMPDDIQSVNIIKDKKEIIKYTLEPCDGIIEITLKKKDN